MFDLYKNQVVGFYYQNVWKTPVEEWHFNVSENFFEQSGSYLGFECNFLFFANALFWASGDNLGLKFPANSCKRVGPEEAKAL